MTAYADPLALVAAPEVDAVVIASPGFVHEEQVLACLQHGKAVLCEKPLTMDDDSALRLVQAEAALGRRLVTVGFMRRFDPEYAAAPGRDHLRGARPVAAPAQHPPQPLGAQRRLPLRDDRARQPRARGRRVALPVRPGGRRGDGAVAQRRPRTPAPGVVDPQVSVFRMSGGGLVTNEVFVNSQVGYEVRFEAVAERGSLTAGLSSAGVLTTRVAADGGSWGGTVPEDYRRRFARAYDIEVQSWADAVRAGGVVGPSAWDGYAATAVSTAGMASLATGRPVPVHLAERPPLDGGDD